MNKLLVPTPQLAGVDETDEEMFKSVDGIIIFRL